ncbi:MAG TPA: hypothetical protein VG899_04880 [Mycobacteriales bacterium]|nr:hypothetical protein [Mycobacteriales bacterium]
MGARVRRGARRYLVVSVLAALAVMTGAPAVAFATSLPAAASDTSATPGVPTSTIEATSAGSVTYCVSNYAPNSDVVVVNRLTGVSKTIHTDATGAGCTTIPVSSACRSTVSQTIVATGTDATGKPATSQVTYSAPPDPTKCHSASPTPTPTKTCAATQAILSVYIVPEGARLRGHACGFTPGELVYIYLHSAPVFVGSTVADADGVAAKHVNVPKCIAPGQHEFMMVGQSSGNVATATFTITKSNACPSSGGSVVAVSAGSGGSTGGTGSGGGSLAFTGADIAAMVLVALVLLALGAALVTVRRRRDATSA